MEPETKKQKGLEEKIGEKDRLSELPDKVLVHILSFLPTLEAVRTVLLKRFGKLWTLVPSLEFSEDKFSGKSGFKGADWEIFSYFANYVDNILALYKRPTIEKFDLDLSVVNWVDDYEAHGIAETGMENWMDFVLAKKAKELSIWCDNGTLFPVPETIFTSQFLVVLKLERCRTSLPRRVRMVSLKSLKLNIVFVEDGNFNKFMTGCNSLQELDMLNPVVFKVANYCSKSIEKLHFWDGTPNKAWTINCPNLKTVRLSVYLENVKAVSVPSVRKASLDFFYIEDVIEEDAHKFKSFMESFQNAEVLTLGQEAVLRLTLCLKVNVGFPQNKWKRIVLNSPIQETYIAGICSLVRNSPCLEELVMCVDGYRDLHVTRVKMINDRIRQEASSDYVAPHLKVVSMRGCRKSYGGELQLAEFLLKSAVNLDKLVISSTWRSKLTSPQGVEFVKQLSNIPRASTKSRIVVE